MGSVALILLLAVIQGLTEFLPVSSSGHLVLMRELAPGGEDLPRDASLEVLLHLGTLLAILIFYRQRIWELIRGCLGYGDDPAAARRTTGLLVVGTLPAILVGLFLRKPVESLFHLPVAASVSLLFTGTVLYLAGRRPAGERKIDSLSAGEVLLIGAAQALAIMPGVSRSGMTIVAGMSLGLTGRASTAFSFLLAIPALTGAAVLKLPDLHLGGFLRSVEDPSLEFGLGVAAVGVLASFAVGYLALGILLWMVRGRRLAWFAPYCWLVGTAGLFLSLTR